MIISPGRGYIFVHIPKTGGTSLALALEERAMKDDILIGDTPKARRRRKRLAALSSRGRLWKHSRLSDIEGILSRDEIHGMRILTVVRNPWDRMASYYHWLRHQNFDHSAVTRAAELGFGDFLRHPDTAAEMRGDRVASYLTTSDGRPAEAVFLRQESFGEDVARLAEQLGLRLDLPHANRSDRPSGYRDLYDPATRRLIEEAYGEDIARFGYAY